MIKSSPGTVVFKALLIERAGSGGMCASRRAEEQVRRRERRSAKGKKMTVSLSFTVFAAAGEQETCSPIRDGERTWCICFLCKCELAAFRTCKRKRCEGKTQQMHQHVKPDIIFGAQSNKSSMQTYKRAAHDAPSDWYWTERLPSSLSAILLYLLHSSLSFQLQSYITSEYLSFHLSSFSILPPSSHISPLCHTRHTFVSLILSVSLPLLISAWGE